MFNRNVVIAVVVHMLVIGIVAPVHAQIVTYLTPKTPEACPRYDYECRPENDIHYDFAPPSDVTQLTVTIIGAGGGGGGGGGAFDAVLTGRGAGGGGGGGGGSAVCTFGDIKPGFGMKIEVGAGGSGGDAGASSKDGRSGGDGGSSKVTVSGNGKSWVYNIYSANGGKGGGGGAKGGITNTAAIGGTGGAPFGDSNCKLGWGLAGEGRVSNRGTETPGSGGAASFISCDGGTGGSGGTGGIVNSSSTVGQKGSQGKNGANGCVLIEY